MALALTPRIKVVDQGPEISLEAMITKQFSEWNVDEGIVWAVGVRRQ